MAPNKQTVHPYRRSLAKVLQKACSLGPRAPAAKSAIHSWFAINTTAFISGVLLVQLCSALCPSPWLYMVGLLLLIAGITARQWPLVFFTAGLLLAHYDAQMRLADRLDTGLQGVDIVLEGVVTSLPESDAHSVRFNFDVMQSVEQVPKHLRLSWYNPPQSAKAGQRWRFTLRLKRPHGSLNPGGFDYERWLLLQNLGATGYVRNPEQAQYLGEAGVSYAVLRWRQRLSERLSELLPSSGNSGLIKALTLGDGQAISHEQWELFRRTGTVHLMVISGSHIALVAGWAYLLVRRFWAFIGCLRYSPQTVAAIAAIICGGCYALLAGFAIPAQRAVIMASGLFLAVLVQRPLRTGHALALAALLTVGLQPVAVLAPGFWLSFGAVALILFVLSGRLRRYSSLASAVKIQWAMSLGLTPLLLLFFQQVSLLSLPANFIAVPLIGFVTVPLALLGILLLPLFPELSRLLLQLTDQSLQVLLWALDGLRHFPAALIAHPQPELWVLLPASLGALLLLAPRGIPKRWLGIVLWLPLLFPLREQLDPGAVKLALLDVGQGLSAVLQTRGHVLVFDTGAKFSDSFDMGESVLLPYLRAQGFTNVDEVIVSHGDNDHAGGLEALLQGIRVAAVSSSAEDISARFAGKPCIAGRQWQWDGVSFSVLSPQPGLFDKDNDNSCVLKVQSSYGSILLPGDIEAGAEAWLVESYRGKLHADILIAPHHGSKTSSSPEFLGEVKPEHVLIPSGYRNRFGFPHRDVLERYRRIGAIWLSSAEAGAITVKLTESGRSITAYREDGRRYWNE